VKHDPLSVFERHAHDVMLRLQRFSSVSPIWPCAMIVVRHATPRGEDVMVGSFGEVEALLHAANVHDVAVELLSRKRYAESSKTFVVAVVHDMYHAPALLEVPSNGK
jgi:hypothetical protein